MKRERLTTSCSFQEELRRLAWDFLEWSQDPPLQLDAHEQRQIAATLVRAANQIDTLTRLRTPVTDAEEASVDERWENVLDVFCRDAPELERNVVAIWVNTLRADTESTPPFAKLCASAPPLMAAEEMRAIYDRALGALRPDDVWIPCAERLPPPHDNGCPGGTTVLVSTAEGHVLTAWYSVRRERWLTAEGGHDIAPPTHWRSLPKAPER